jgi:hypothetical protein
MLKLDFVQIGLGAVGGMAPTAPGTLPGRQRDVAGARLTSVIPARMTMVGTLGVTFK